MYNRLLTRKGRLEGKIETELKKPKPNIKKIIEAIDEYEFDNIKTITKLKKDKKNELKRINGALKQTIDAHGPIDKVLIGSASKRIHGALLDSPINKKKEDKEKISVRVFLSGVGFGLIIFFIFYLLFK